MYHIQTSNLKAPSQWVHRHLTGFDDPYNDRSALSRPQKRILHQQPSVRKVEKNNLSTSSAVYCGPTLKHAYSQPRAANYQNSLAAHTCIKHRTYTEETDSTLAASSESAGTTNSVSDDLRASSWVNRESPNTVDLTRYLERLSVNSRLHKTLTTSAYMNCDTHVVQRFSILTGIGSNVFGQKLLLRMMKMLHLCKYHVTDIIYIMALASCQLDDCFSKLSVMDGKERANVCVLQVFLSHCWLQDETCPIKVWHSNLFKSYCTFATLQDALFKLFLIQEFSLKVDDQRVHQRVRELVYGSHRTEG
uniref:Uncharacterized protein n=1 Tax=Chromera velia CCMP2878 TaxID=1169474 RepID=A0A0G4HYA5_9ALVE|eukprot:Cvel_9444.t1-p1 / transcript=Cvel_9444.t1 / gene=Cvel_9444 / organism=Chromera_velia_CCMP2878 / gene_product=hypothetical protein / transcript_product=hypothetical protein / location=Cvel_scaffold544:65211-66328(+) / protein_length=304 / sequence_SO=supercontig / SO=protein_coding / is_pseudo=false